VARTVGGNRGSGNTGKRGVENAGHGGGAPGGDVVSDECRYCGKHEHWARECRKKKKDEEVHDRGGR
jgi:hypothetical protein